MPARQTTKKRRRDLRHTISRLIDLCDPIYDPEALDGDVTGAVAAVEKLMNVAIASETQVLRAALKDMVTHHRWRFPLSGPCVCTACENAEKLLRSCN